MAGDDRRQGAEDRPAASDLHRRTRPRLRADRSARLSWKLTIREGPRVRHDRFDELDPALSALERRARQLAEDSRLEEVDTKLRQYEPAERVAARLQLAGPQRLLPDIHAGIDVRGDGSMQAWRGQVRRALIEPEPGEDAVEALRRTLAQGAEI